MTSRICLDFLPISAENAFLFRTVSGLNFDNFKKLNKDLVERLGRDEVGKSRWRSLTPDEKNLAAYKAVTSDTYKHSFEDTNFDKLLQAFALRVGGNEAQLSLIGNQLKLILNSLSFDTVVAQELGRLSYIYRALPWKAIPYKIQFWGVYTECIKPCVASLKSDANHRGLQRAMSQLIAYAQFVEENEENDDIERKKIVKEMTSLVCLQIHVLLEHNREPNGWTKECFSLYRELYEWDGTHKCWVDLTTCGPHCSEGFECRSEEHLVWWNHKGAPGQWEHRQNSGCDEWYNATTGQSIPWGRFDDMLKPPPTAFAAPASPPAQLIFGTSQTTASAQFEFDTKIMWDNLTPIDLCTISESILLLAYSRTFCLYFGREKALLERSVSQFNYWIAYLDTANLAGTLEDTLLMRRAHTLLVKALQGSHNDKGEFVPKYPHQYKLVVHVEMPRRLSDPSHWGHLAWQFCEFMDANPSYGDLLRSA
jgi:hypothetical protein